MKTQQKKNPKQIGETQLHATLGTQRMSQHTRSQPSFEISNKLRRTGGFFNGGQNCPHFEKGEKLMRG
jgi:hypothetical protein